VSGSSYLGDEVFRSEHSIIVKFYDDVMGAIKSEFEEYGVAEDVLADLQEV